jgi:hypothetical protein
MGDVNLYFSIYEGIEQKTLESGIEPYSGLSGSVRRTEQTFDRLADSSPSAPDHLKLGNCVKLSTKKSSSSREVNLRVDVSGMDCYAVTEGWYDSMCQAFINGIDAMRPEQQIIRDSSAETHVFWETLREVTSLDEITDDDIVLVPGRILPERISKG